MKLSLFALCLCFTMTTALPVIAQQGGGGTGGGGTGGGTAGGAFGGATGGTSGAATSRAPTGTTSSSQIMGSPSPTSSGLSNAGSSTGSNAFGGNLASPSASLIANPGFLYPVQKKGFLIPSNAQRISNSSRSTGALGSSSRAISLGGAGGAGGLGGLSGLLGRGMGNQLNQGAQAAATAAALRIPMRPSLASNVVANTTSVRPVVAFQFNERRARLPGLESLGTVTMSIDGRTARLRGFVATEQQREQLTRLALLELGISNVENELVVDSSQAVTEQLPPATQSPR